jgi:RimJ/RimL family protein N-acetyltransferase
MATSQTAGVYLLTAEHAEAIERLALDPAISEAMRALCTGPTSARDFVASQLKQRDEGTGYGFAIVDRKDVVGVVTLSEPYAAEGPNLHFWVGRPYWRNGYATFGVRMTLEFAFQSLRLERVNAGVQETNVGARRVLERHGFERTAPASQSDAASAPGDEPRAVYAILRTRWIELRDNPAVARLHPGLRAILDAELAAGNEVLETGSGFPDPESVFVRLRHPFRTRPSPLPDGLVYSEPNDPHWWMADYSSRSPRHILSC